MPILAHRLVAALVAALAVHGTAPAQTPVARVPHAGRVLDKDKKAVPNAKVTLVSGSEYGSLDEGDLVRVDADAEGRFCAQLQPTRSYVAWTTTPCDDGVAVCAPVDVGTLPIELTAGMEKAATAFRLEGLEAWREYGEISVEISLFACSELTIRAKPDSSGEIALPPLPSKNADVRVFAGGKFVHWPVPFPLRSCKVPKPYRLAIRATDEKGRPLAKTCIERILQAAGLRGPFRLSKAWSYPVATTGEDGTAEVLIAFDEDPFTVPCRDTILTFRARRDGHAAGCSGFSTQPFVNSLRVDAREPKGVLPFVLNASTAKRIRILAPEGQMPGVVYRMSFSGLQALPVREGALRLEEPDVGGDGELQVASLLPPLPPDDPWQRSALALPLVLPESAVDRGKLDLRSVVPLRLQVLDAGAGPAIGAHVLCSPKGTRSFVDPESATYVRADRAGRAVLPILPGSCFVIAVTDDGVAHSVVEAAAGLAPQTLQLHPFDRMRVRVVDGDGKPVEGVRFEPKGRSQFGSDSAERVLCTVGWQLSSWAMRKTLTDANGNADVPFFAAPELYLHMEATKDNRTASDIQLQAGDGRVDIVLK